MDGIGKARHAWVRIRKQNILHKTFMVIGYLSRRPYIQNYNGADKNVVTFLKGATHAIISYEL